MLAGGLVLGHCISLLYSCTAVPIAVWVHLAHGSCSCGVVSTSLYTLYTPYAVRYANNVRLTLSYQINPFTTQWTPVATLCDRDGKRY